MLIKKANRMFYMAQVFSVYDILFLFYPCGAGHHHCQRAGYGGQDWAPH